MTNFTKTTRITAIVLVILLVTKTFADIPCPSQCQCSRYYVKCNGKGLRAIPKGIPITARIINLSNNPQITIPSSYFLQFKQLVTLYLTNCGQRGPLYLPNTVKDLTLEYNTFTADALKEMLSSKSQSIRRINLKSNHLSISDTMAVLKVLPAGLTLLNLNQNALKKLKRKDMLRFKKIKRLQIEECSLESIEANVFDDMRSLSTLCLNGNKLTSLPDNMLRHNLQLVELQLTDNRLTEFNATKLSLRRVTALRLQFNRISTFDIRDLISPVTILSDNNIRKLDTNIFKNNKGILELNFSNNNIQFISGTAFHGIRGVSQLLLNNNSLYSLPEGLFKGMTLNTVLLQNNRLSTFKGVFNGIENSRVTLMLHGNINFTLLNGSEFQSLSRESKLYINCQKLKRVYLTELKARVVCSPKAKEVIQTRHFRSFSCNGYDCERDKVHAMYKCKACRPGYYTPCRDTRQYRSTCVQCPPGSYYQDQSASIKCKICRPGQFVPPERSPGKDANDCQTCPEGTNTTSVAGTRACKCLHGYSRRYRFGPCRKCSIDGFNCSKDYKVLQNGFWMTWQGINPKFNLKVEEGTSRQRTCQYSYNAFVKNLDIVDDTYDRTTMHFNCQMPLPSKCPFPRSCIGGIQPECSLGYTGVLCAVCKRGYVLDFDQCVKCPESLKAVTQLIGYIASFVIFCFIISLTDEISVNEPLRNDRYPNIRTFADILLANLKILIGFYQVLISIVKAFSQVHWPENLRSAVNVFQYIQIEVINLASIRCLNLEWNITAFDELWIVFITITSISFLVVAYYLIKSTNIYSSNSFPSEATYNLGRNCIQFVALFLFVTYSLLSTKIIETLPISCHSFCTAKQNGTCLRSMSFLRSDYSIPCPTMGDNKRTVIIGYSLLTIPLSMPVLLLVLLWVNTQTQFTITPSAGQVPMMTSAIRFTYENYHSRYWYWEVIEMIRKLLMTIGVIIFVGHTKIGLTCTIIAAMIFTILHAIFKPCKSKFENGAQFLSLILIPLNLAFGAVLQSQDSQNPRIISNGLDSLSLGILLVIMNSSLVLAVIARIIVVIARQIRLKCS